MPSVSLPALAVPNRGKIFIAGRFVRYDRMVAFGDRVCFYQKLKPKFDRQVAVYGLFDLVEVEEPNNDRF